MSTLSQFLIDTHNLRPNPQVDKMVQGMVSSVVKAGPQINPEDNRRIRPGKFAISPQDTYATRYSSGTGTYYWYYDEALRNSIYNALAMRRSDIIQESLEHRKMASVSKDWFLKPDDPDDADQQRVCDQLESVIEKTYMFKDYILGLLEDIYFGKAAVQASFNYEVVKGKRRLCVVDHAPIMGDKIQYRFDNTPGILVYSASPMFELPEYKDKIGRATLGLALYLTEPWLRDCFTISQFRKSDFDYIWEGDKALAVQGIGMRDTTYWAWNLRTEILSWITDALQRVGANGMTYGVFEYGNAEAEKQMIQFIKTLVKDSYAVVGVDAKTDPQNLIKNIPVSAVGYDVMIRILEYLDDSIRRIFLGQELTSTAKATGLGASTANIQKSAFDHIVKYDSDRLSETLSRQFVNVLLKYNTWTYKGQEVPGDQLPFSIYFKFEDRDSEDDAPADTAKTLHEMGVPLDVEDIRDKTDFVAPRDRQSLLPGKPGETSATPNGQPKGKESSVPPNGRKQFAGFGNNATNGKGSPSLNQVEIYAGPSDEKRDESGKWTNGQSHANGSTKKSTVATKENIHDVNDHIKSIFNRRIDREAISALAGSPAGSHAEISMGGNSIKVSWKTDKASAERSIRRDDNGDLVMDNISFNINESERGKGIGSEIFGKQVDAAKSMGVSKIQTIAIRDDDSNGYKVWPMFGYDGDIPDSIRDESPNGEKRISELMKTSEGRNWWSETGHTVELSFDLSPDSYSMKTWESYKRMKKGRK